MEHLLGLKEILLAIIVAANTLLAVWVFQNNPRSATNIIFIVLSATTSAWLITMYISAEPRFFSWALVSTRLTTFLAIPQSVCFFLLAYVIPGSALRLRPLHLGIIGGSALFMMYFTLTPFVFSDVEVVNNTTVQHVESGMAFFSLYVITFSIGAIYTLSKKMRQAMGIERAQLRFTLVGTLLMLGMIIATILIPMLVFSNDSLVPLAPLYVFAFLGMTAFAIVRHRLLDIRFFLIRSLSFFFFIVVCAGIYILVLLFIAQKVFGVPISIPIALAALGILILTTLGFQPIFRALRRVTSKVFFKDNYDGDALIRELTHTMAQSIDLEYMTSRILLLLIEKMTISKAAMLVVHDRAIMNVIPLGYQKETIEKAHWETLFTKYPTETTFVFEEMTEGTLKQMLRISDVSIAITIKVEQTPVGILLLGPKLSGEIYTTRDFEILDIFASEAGIAIQNAKAYEAIKKFNKELEQRVEERTRELKKSQESELAKANAIAQLKDEFVFIAAHELRTPITAIRGFLDLVSQETKDYPKEVKEKLQYIGMASDHLHQLINDLLEISRSEGSNMKLATKPVDLVPLIQGIIKELAPVAAQREVTFYLEVAGKADQALADEQKLREIIMNLFSNAIKYNRIKGKVDITVFPVDHSIMIEVRDTGFGIPEQQQGKIFQKFFRAQGKQTAEVLGTGLGLFITRMLVEKMGGKIDFTSYEDKGTTFAVLLPQADNKK